MKPLPIGSATWMNTIDMAAVSLDSAMTGTEVCDEHAGLSCDQLLCQIRKPGGVAGCPAMVNSNIAIVEPA